MPQVLVRDLDAAVVARLKERARLHRHQGAAPAGVAEIDRPAGPH